MSAPLELPDPVSRAFDVSRRSGYVSFCRNETGRLLATLAATRTGTLAEFGTGCGVGTAWLRSGVRDTHARILTARTPRRQGITGDQAVTTTFARACSRSTTRNARSCRPHCASR